MSDAARIEREREYHDQRYVGLTREALDKYYSISSGAMAHFRDLLGDTSGARILEYGCGTDQNGLELARDGATVEAIDISPVAVDQVNQAAADTGLADSFHASVMNAEVLTFDDGAFDLVIGTGILHHLELEAAYSEIARVLSTDGHAVFFEPLGHNPAINLYRRLTPKMRTPDEHPLLESDFDLARQQFDTVDVTYFSATSLGAVPFRHFAWFPNLVRRLDRVDEAMFRRSAIGRRLAWTCVVHLSAPRARSVTR